jgi:hypothetical protein
MANQNPAAGAAASAVPCNSKNSITPGCHVDCKAGPITLSLKSTNNTANIVAADYGGTAITITSPTSITFTVKTGVFNLTVSYAITPGDIGTLFEACANQTVWDNNVDTTGVVPYAVCS